MRYLPRSARRKTPKSAGCTSRQAFLETLENRHLLAAEFVPGEILVAMDKYSARFQEDGRAAAAAAKPFFRSLGMHSPEVMFDLAAGPNNSARLVTKWSVGADVDIEQLAEQLAQMSGVVYAEPNAVVTGAAGPTDAAFTATAGSDWGTRFGLQEHLTGHSVDGTPTAHVGALEAWDVPGVNYGAGVRVAVLDSGINLGHPDLVGSLARNPDNSVLGFNFITPGANPEDEYGHGTHVSGLIAATMNNTDRAFGTDDPSWNGGVTGVAPSAKIMPVKIFDANGGGNVGVIAQAVDWAVANQAQVINMSLGYTGYTQGLYDAVTRAYNAGVIVVVAAHNHNVSAPMYPGAHPMALGVGAVDKNDLGTSFTRFGSWVDVSAPGLRVLSTKVDTAGSAIDGYSRGSGTSMSAPIVSGVAALILAQNPTWTPVQVAAQIVGTADDIYHLPGNAGYADQLGSGRVNAFRAVSETLGLPHVVSASTRISSEQPVTVRFSQGMDPNIDLLASGQPANFEVRYDANGDTIFAANERIDISFFDVDGVGGMPADYVLGPTVALKLGSAAVGQYQLSVKGGAGGVYDAFGQPLGDASGNAIAEHTSTFTIATATTAPQIVVTPTSGLVTTESGGAASFTVSLSQAPTADVLIRLNSMDSTEGLVSAAAESLTFTSANWNVPQTIAVTGQDDALVDGTITYTVFTGLASSADPLFNGINPANVSLTNLDNDVPPTKFYVVNDGSPDRTHEYSATGTPIENYALSSGNSAPRGAVSTAAGDKVWVVDANRKVYVYNPSGVLLGSWTAGTLPSNATVEGIATNGTDIWIVDAKADKTYRYTGAASRLSGSQNAASSFNLNTGNTSAKDIVTDGTSLWVLNDANTDKVFKYTIAGGLLGSWTITNASEPSPTGITLDPASPGHLWIVGSGIDRVYQYDNAVGRTSGSQAPSTSFTLAGGNTNPQGIADPPAPQSSPVSLPTYDFALWALVEELDDFIGPRRRRN